MKLRDLYPNRPQYRPGEAIWLTVERELAGETCEICAILRVEHMAETLFQRELTVVFEAEQKQSSPVEAGVFESEAGYGAALEACGQVLYTAFDVAQEGSMPRYGFLCRFDDEDPSAAPVEDLLKHHITWVQFYDWMYRHEQLLPAEADFTDLMGRRMNMDCVRRRVEQCRQLGLKPMAYGAVYAASYPFAHEHPDWMLYGAGRKPLDFIGLLRYMDISENTPWREHITHQFAGAVGEMGFAGIHMDTYGYPKDALRADGTAVHLAQQFPSLISDTRRTIRTETGVEPLLVFNNVGNWPVDTVANAEQDAIYIEVWPPYERYVHLRNIAIQTHLLQRHKPLILAAYAKTFMDAPQKQAWHSAFLLQGVLAASGAHPLLLGENGGVLMQAYYADHYTETEDAWRMRQRCYSDFAVRWEELLYAPDRRDVTMTHALGDNCEYCFRGAPISLEMYGGSVGVTIVERPDLKMVHLLDLRASDDLWQTGKQPAENPYALEVDMLVLRPPKRVYTASPEEHGGCAQPADWQLCDSERGLYARVKVSTAQPWMMIVLEEGV